MHRRDVITFPGPGGSSISCCIIPCGCIMVLLASLLLGSIGLFLHAHSPPHVRQVAAAGAARADTGAALPRP